MTCEDTCPCLLFAHFTSNQALIEAFEGKKRVHVIDFSMKLGSQWPSLMQALALRPEGPPTFRLTGIGPSANRDHVQDVGLKLEQLAETLHVEFECRGVVAESLADIEPAMLDIREGEVVAINSVFELNHLLARPGEIDKVLTAVKEMKPHIFTVVESSGVVGEGNQDIGKHTCNMLAKEGLEQVELDQMLAQWKIRFNSGGFISVHLGSNAYKQANILLDLFGGGEGNKVEENDGCLMLCWYAIPLIMASAWKW